MERTEYGSANTRIAEVLLELAQASTTQITRETGLPPGTVKATLGRMRKSGHVTKLPSGPYVLRTHPDTGQTYTFHAQLTAEPVGETSADDAAA